ncbi:MAG TPA: hypothetical protein VGC62_05300, partial [Pseudomonas sp.]|uniref:hypothetical protein n=1 Tax=Pseudomonas sp. TaxID=306 RepID=UPI002ED7EC1B
PPISRDQFGNWRVDRKYGLRGGSDDGVMDLDLDEVGRREIEQLLRIDDVNLSPSGVQAVNDFRLEIVPGGDILSPVGAAGIKAGGFSSVRYLSMSELEFGGSMVSYRNFSAAQLDTIDSMLVLSLDLMTHQTAYATANRQLIEQALAAHRFRMVSSGPIGSRSPFLLVDHPDSNALYVVYPRRIEQRALGFHSVRMPKSAIGDRPGNWPAIVRQQTMHGDSQAVPRVDRAILDNALTVVVAGVRLGVTAAQSDVLFRKLQFL